MQARLGGTAIQPGNRLKGCSGRRPREALLDIGNRMALSSIAREFLPPKYRHTQGPVPGKGDVRGRRGKSWMFPCANEGMQVLPRGHDRAHFYLDYYASFVYRDKQIGPYL